MRAPQPDDDHHHVLGALSLSELHRLLARQIKRHLGDLDAQPESVRNFVRAVNAAYLQSDEDRTMLERTLDLSSQELLQANSEMQAIFQSFPDLFLRSDRQGLILSVKAGASKNIALAHEAIVGKGLEEVLGAEVGARISAALLRVIESRDSETVEYEIEGPGSKEHHEARVVPLLADQAIVILRNITERKAAQDAMKHARDAAEAANTLKSQFLANMSHELRTPLNAIIGYSEMLREDAESTGRDDLVPDLDRIHGAGSHLLALINDILDLSKIEAGKMELFLEGFSIPELVWDVVATVEPLMERRGNEFQVHCADDLGEARADVTKVRQILLNMLSNASKFTEAGRIVLDVAVESAGGSEEVVFQVTDSGIGMSEAQLARLFQPFTQADASTTRKYGGTGLGLVISRRFCDMMGGTIVAESSLGRGTRFTVRLPRRVVDARQPAPAQASPASQLAEPAGTADDFLVLVIDDDPAARDLITRIVTKEGLRCACAASGEEGIQLARKLRPTLITLDVLMPGMDGWTVLTKLKSDPDLADIPVAMLSMLHNQSLGYSLGASDYVTKPVDRVRLSHLLRKFYRPPCLALVVEDDVDTRGMLVQLLRREGWNVYEAENGRVALEVISEHTPQLVLLDLLMPEMDGFQFVEEFRSLEAMAQVPIVVLTALSLSADDHRRLNGSVERIVRKGAQPLERLGLDLRALVMSRAALPQAEPAS